MKSIVTNDDLVLPDYIESNLQYTNKNFRIPTANGVETRPIRRFIVETSYKTMLSQMQGNNFIKNEFLNENVYLVFRESYLKASNNSVRNWQSTYAVLHLYDVIKYAVPENEIYITKDIKRGFQQNNHYKELYKLVYNFKNEYITYMNFPVEIVFGRKTTGKLVQYSIEYKKTVSKSMPEPI